MRKEAGEQSLTLVLIRHGMTQANKTHRYLGKTDEQLCKQGRKQLQADRDSGRYPPLDLLFSSPMKRCVQTAACLYPAQQPILIPEWEEIDFGDFEGKTWKELRTDMRYQAWIDSGGTLAFPQGESRAAFCARCESGFHRLLAYLKQQESPAQTIGLVVHGGVIMALLSRYAGGNYFDYQVENAGGYVCALQLCMPKPIVCVQKKL